ncbi:MAG: hypothetical protein Q8P29_02655 [Candidatus Levybacteria bacterium]|nr:hypothetical protein [Candidatus Levybacteria bacterium]
MGIKEEFKDYRHIAREFRSLGKEGIPFSFLQSELLAPFVYLCEKIWPSKESQKTISKTNDVNGIENGKPRGNKPFIF